MSSLEIKLISLKETSESNSKRVEDLSKKLKQVLLLLIMSQNSDYLMCFAVVLPEVHFTLSFNYFASIRNMQL